MIGTQILNTVILALFTASAAFAQEPGQQVPDDQAIPSLMFFTLFAALAIGIGGLMYFLRKRSNRDVLTRGSDDPRNR
jgi:hypothetical protein